MGKLTWKTAKLHLDFSFILFSSFTMTITLKFPFPPFPSAEVWGEVEVWGLLLPDWFFRGDCRCIQQHSWGSSPLPGLAEAQAWGSEGSQHSLAVIAMTKGQV